MIETTKHDLEKAVSEYVDHLKTKGHEDGDSNFTNAIMETAVEYIMGPDAFDIINQLIDERDTDPSV